LPRKVIPTQTSDIVLTVQSPVRTRRVLR